jgi:restriction system protein
MELPKYDELYKDILDSVADGKEHNLTHIREYVAKVKNVSDSDRALLLKSGVRGIFDDRISWARTYLRAAGLIDYPKRGETLITEEGKKVLAQGTAQLNNAFLRQYESFRNFQMTSRDSTSPIPSPSSEGEHVIVESQENNTPAERIDSAFSEINSSLGDELLSEIMSQDPVFLEDLVVKLLVKMGYGGMLGDEAGTVTKLTRDEGIDGIIREDKLGFSSVYVQAKRWDTARTVNRPDLQAFVGAIANKKGNGLFVTTATFSDGAKQCAKENHIAIIDGKLLASLMIEYGLGVSTVQTYEIKKLDSDFFPEKSS